MLTQTRTGLVAESLLDGKRISVGMRHNVSLLSEISVFTLKDEISLREVFLKIQEKEDGGKTSVEPKASKEQLEEYFFEVLPEYDEDRVYPSHISKILKWYNMLLEHGLSDFSEPESKEGQEEQASQDGIATSLETEKSESEKVSESSEVSTEQEEVRADLETKASGSHDKIANPVSAKDPEKKKDRAPSKKPGPKTGKGKSPS